MRRKATGLIAAAALGAALAGCTSGHTFVLEPAGESAGSGTVLIRRAASHVEVDAELAERFEAKLAARLARDAGLTEAEDADLVLEYRFVLFDSGSTAMRLGAGAASLLGSPFYGLGDGAVGVDVNFVDREGRGLARIVVDGPISGAFGSSGGGLDTAASSVSKFTARHFTVRDRTLAAH